MIENESKNTDLQVTSIKELTEIKTKGITQSKEDKEILWYVLSRKRTMAKKRTALDKKWQQFVKQYEAEYVPYTDWRSASNVPLERAIIDLFVAEAIKRPTTFNFNWELDYKFQEQVLEKVWDYDWEVNNRESEIMNNEYLTAIFWTSIIYTWYNKSYRIISDFEWEDEDGKIKFQRRLQTKADIIMKNIDIRDFWVDEKARNINEAVDCIFETYISYEEFLNLYLDNNYDDNVLESIAPSKLKHDEYKPFTLKEERWDWETKFVKITRYWNTKLDTYIEIANESVVIKKHPILNATHDLPFTVRQYEKNIFSIYWTWLCDLLVTFKSDINTLREMLMDSIKKSNQETIAIWSNLSFNWNQFAYGNQLMKFKWNLQWNLQQLTWTPPNQAIFNRLQDLFKEVAVFTGIDIMNILWEPQQTAYQTAVQKESSSQRINVILKNRDEAFERLANLMKDNYQLFYPLKIVRQLVNINEDNEPIEDIEATYPTIETNTIKNNKFSNWTEKQIFEVTPEVIRWQIKLDVSTDLNVNTINEVEKAQKIEFFTSIAWLSQSYAQDPDLDKIIPKKKAIRDLAKLFHIDIQESANQEIKEEKEALYKELQTMMQWVNKPAVNPNQESALAEWWWAELAPETEAWWIVPSTPNIS